MIVELQNDADSMEVESFTLSEITDKLHSDEEIIDVACYDG